MTTWNELIEYINKHEQSFTPVQVRCHLDSYSSVLTTYINYLHKAKFIRRIDRGTYIKEREIPTSLTIKKVREFVYNDAGMDNKSTQYYAREKAVEKYWKLKDIKNNIDNKNTT